MKNKILSVNRCRNARGAVPGRFGQYQLRQCGQQDEQLQLAELAEASHIEYRKNAQTAK